MAKWFAAVKKAFRSKPSPEDVAKAEAAPSKEDKKKSHRRWSFGRSTKTKPETGVKEVPEKNNLVEAGQQQSKHAIAVAAATAAAAEAAVAAAHAAAEVVRLTGSGRGSSIFSIQTPEEWAATRIQTAFRGYLARRALRALKGLVRLQALVRGHTVRKQAHITLRCMQALVRVQARVRARRVRMSEEGQAVQRQIHARRQAETQSAKSLSDTNPTASDGWIDSVGSLQDVQAKIQSRQEAAMKRERAMAYAFSHQVPWRSPSKDDGAAGAQMVTDSDPDKPHWGWSWLERWMAARPWESRVLDKDLTEGSDDGLAKALEMEIESERRKNSTNPNQHQLQNPPPQATNSQNITYQNHQSSYQNYPSYQNNYQSHQNQQSCSAATPMTRSYSTPGTATPRDVHTAPHSPLTPPPVVQKPASIHVRSASPRPRTVADDDVSTARSGSTMRSCASMPYGALKFGRCSVTSSVRDDDSLMSFPAGLPNYMAITESAKAKFRSHSTPKQRPGTPDRENKDPYLSARRRLSFPDGNGPPNGPRKAAPFGYPQRSPSMKSLSSSNSKIEKSLLFFRESHGESAADLKQSYGGFR